MNEPKIKLRDGWQWVADSDFTWGASSRDAQVDWLPKRRLVWLSRGDEAPPDVMLAVIEANAPEVLREFLAGQATPGDRTCPPPRWEVCEFEDGIECRLNSGDTGGSTNSYTEEEGGEEAAVREAWRWEDESRALAYPELAARIAELEREVAALHEEREREFLAGLATLSKGGTDG